MTTTQIAIKMVLDRWYGSITNANKLLSELSNEQLEKEIALSKNRGVYLLGHLIAVHDDMLRLLDMGEKQYPALYEPFIKNADNKAVLEPSIDALRSMWTALHNLLQEKFDTTSTEEWFSKHSAVSEEDFAKEPHRNKLNIIITRTSHLQYHTGQLVLLK